jgi:hypothetical protein
VPTRWDLGLLVARARRSGFASARDNHRIVCSAEGPRWLDPACLLGPAPGVGRPVRVAEPYGGASCPPHAGTARDRRGSGAAATRFTKAACLARARWSASHSDAIWRVTNFEGRYFERTTAPPQQPYLVPGKPEFGKPHGALRQTSAKRAVTTSLCTRAVPRASYSDCFARPGCRARG